jgi:molybdenum cofactor cytidylyltransferase
VTQADVALIVLAAGHSARMGGPNKLLMAWRGTPLIARAVKGLEDLSFCRRILVTGRDPAEVVAAAQVGQDWDVVHNPDAACGLASSLNVGLSALSAGQCALVVLGDMPSVIPEVFRALLDAWVPTAYAVVPACNGAWGNPVFLGPDAIKDCLGLSGDRGARGLLIAHKEAVIEVTTTCSGILFDVDIAEDFDA